MLRLALIENLRRVAVRIAAGRMDRDLAVTWADKLTKVVRQDPKNLILVIADMARSIPPMTTPFVSELARRLQGQGPALALPLTWIEQQLAESGLNIEQLVRSGNQQQAADQVTISNSIGSLRFLGTMDWREFVEAMSVVEHALRTDPAAAYAAMDFASRDRYRHVIEHVAKTSGLSEDAAAGRAIELARAGAARHGGGDRTAHVGFYLVDRGLPELENAAQVRLPPAAALRRAASRSPLLLYLGAIALITAFVSASLLMEAQADGVTDWAGAAGHPRAAGRQPACGGAGELADHLAGDAASAAAHGFLRGHPAGIAHPGWWSRPCSPARTTSSVFGSTGSEVPRQSRRQPALRPADRFPRCCRGNARRRR
ncbi:MAG: hypothetical protein M5R42_17830 [Rhodocyclaceae bacterium]|nr:hypothetical protein [Rhodocyclaceae bacterium]